MKTGGGSRESDARYSAIGQERSITSLGLERAVRFFLTRGNLLQVNQAVSKKSDCWNKERRRPTRKSIAMIVSREVLCVSSHQDEDGISRTTSHTLRVLAERRSDGSIVAGQPLMGTIVIEEP